MVHRGEHLAGGAFFEHPASDAVPWPVFFVVDGRYLAFEVFGGVLGELGHTHHIADVAFSRNDQRDLGHFLAGLGRVLSECESKERKQK